jgi:cytochrome c oxidase subunit 3
MTTDSMIATNKVKEGDQIISSVTMVVTLVSFGMLFLTLMMSFALFRFTSEVWPPAGMVRPSLLIPSISTLFIALSSWAFYKYEQNIQTKKFLIATTVLGVAFMVSQFIFWSQLKAHGIFVSSGIFPSIMYSFTWIHAAHIVAALLLLGWLFFDAKNESKAQMRVQNVGKFWHFLGIVWLIMFVTIFVL